MSSAKRRLFSLKRKGWLPEKSGPKGGLRSLWPMFERLLLGRRAGFRRRLSIQVWLTVLFLLVTAFAGGTAYSIVYPRLAGTLQQTEEDNFEGVFDQFEDQLRGNPRLTEEYISFYAINRGLQWGVVGEDGRTVRGDPGEYDEEAVRTALANGSPDVKLTEVESGEREGQTLATYAAPVTVPGETSATIVFTKYYAEGEILNTSEALDSINKLALLAGALALLITGFSGYVFANLLSRRLNRLDVAARRLASGNFDERISTRIEDEVGSLGETFNAMASSLKGAFRQAQQEKARGEAILYGMTDAVVGVDRDLNATFLNPRARELLESSDPAFHKRLQEVLAKSRFSGPVTEPEAWAGDRIIEIRAAPLEDGALAILRDVTEERQIEHAKAEFIANASHELKTPLFALSGYLEMLEDEDDEKVRKEFLRDMKAQTERLESLAKTLLDLSRLDANAVTFRLEEVDLEDLLHELKRDFAYTGREIHIHSEEGIPPVETDPIQLYRMLAILLDNALKYSGGLDGEKPVELELHREDGHALVSVTDRGCGIPEAEIPHIFDRFYRAQGSSRADGTGLGLALAGEISQHLGGDIRVESRPNLGSTFSVELPLAREAGEENTSSTDKPNINR
ncbi:MAG: cell wall metabolism sensor histidine kinase WalK [Actinomycetota bacterium]|nr:cell wall metabolism sensor histidine kinase WalK [Actinomycetota bacterium]